MSLPSRQCPKGGVFSTAKHFKIFKRGNLLTSTQFDYNGTVNAREKVRTVLLITQYVTGLAY